MGVKRTVQDEAIVSAKRQPCARGTCLTKLQQSEIGAIGKTTESTMEERYEHGNEGKNLLYIIQYCGHEIDWIVNRFN